MVDMGTYKFKYLDIGDITPAELFTYDYAEEIHEFEQVHTSTKQLHTISNAKYEKEDLNKVTENQFQHLTEVQCNELLKLLQKTKSFLMENMAPGKQIQYTLN